jgi:hypothetical protein
MDGYVGVARTGSGTEKAYVLRLAKRKREVVMVLD